MKMFAAFLSVHSKFVCPKSKKLPPLTMMVHPRMGSIYKELIAMEDILDGIEKPRNLPFSVLMYITDNFSVERKIGHGGCGEVYKGHVGNLIVAVKRLFSKHTLEDKQFNQEALSMTMVEHPNIVRFIGYCSNTEQKATKVDGKFVFAEIRERLLCLEYISNGSLDNHLEDELRGHEWDTRYKIIKGICKGLHHLHKEKGIIHMDLKPANILIDDYMVPKIADFGLSRSDEVSQTLSNDRLFSLGYCAPEYQYHGKMSPRSDIYSLGVIIKELVTGRKEKPDTTNVLRWKHRWNRSSEGTLLEYQQVIKCIELALSCMNEDPENRPSISEILDAFDQTDKANASEITVEQITSCLEDMLGIDPLELHFPFEPNKQTLCSFQLINDTDYYFAFEIQTTNPMQYLSPPIQILPDKGVVQPRSNKSVTIMVQAQEQAPKFKHCLFSVRSTRVDADRSLTALDISKDVFCQKRGRAMDNVSLMAVFDIPPLSEEPQTDLSEVPHLLLDEDCPNYQETGETSDDIQLSAPKVATSSKVVFPLTLWLGLRHFVERHRRVKKVPLAGEMLGVPKHDEFLHFTCKQVPSGEMFGVPKHDEERPPAAQPQQSISPTPMFQACSGMDLTVIHQILVDKHYSDDESTNELSFDEWTDATKEAFNHRKHGDIAFRDKDFEAASEHYTKFLDGPIDSPTVFARLSLCDLMCDRPDAAVQNALQAQVLYPDWPTAFYMQAVALAKLSMFDDVTTRLNIALELEVMRRRANGLPA